MRMHPMLCICGVKLSACFYIYVLVSVYDCASCYYSYTSAVPVMLVWSRIPLPLCVYVDSCMLHCCVLGFACVPRCHTLLLYSFFHNPLYPCVVLLFSVKSHIVFCVLHSLYFVWPACGT